MQKAVGEDVAAFRVSAELDLVHRQEFDVAAQRHGLDRADKVDRTRRNDLFFAGDQGDGARAAQLYHPVINLARQKSQGQADHAGRMAEHPLDRIMGLARIGGA